jgi:hypothetical protein
MRLDLDGSYIQNGPTLFSKPTLGFLLPIMIKGGKSTTMRTQTLFDSWAFACFIDKELVRQHNLALLEKTTLVVVEVIDGWNFFQDL